MTVDGTASYRTGDVRAVVGEIILPAGVSATMVSAPAYQFEGAGGVPIGSATVVDTYDASATAGGMLKMEKLQSLVGITPNQPYFAHFTAVVQRSDLSLPETVQILVRVSVGAV